MKLMPFDTETTGVEPPIGVVEVAWLELDSDMGVVLDSEKCYLIDPEIPIECGAAGVHGIRQEDITEDLPTLSEIDWPSGEIIFVAHNAPFDRPLLEPYLNIVEELCTLRLARRLLPDAPDHKLSTLSCYCDLSRQLPHRALGDVLTTAWLLDYLIEGSGLNIQELIAYSKEPMIFTRMPWGKHKGLMMEEVPRGYLQWCIQQDIDEDMRATANHWLK